MDEEIERLVVQVRADTQGFASDVSIMRSQIEGPFAEGMARAGQALEGALLGALRRGKLGFEDLRSAALAVIDQIAAAAIQAGLDALGGSGSGGGLLNLATSVLGSALGLPGRATGGPVSPGRAYMVGERGPEMFVPSGFGRIASAPEGRANVANVRLTINVMGAAAQSAPEAMQRSTRQIARAVRRALNEA